MFAGDPGRKDVADPLIEDRLDGGPGNLCTRARRRTGYCAAGGRSNLVVVVAAGRSAGDESRVAAGKERESGVGSEGRPVRRHPGPARTPGRLPLRPAPSRSRARGPDAEHPAMASPAADRPRRRPKTRARRPSGSVLEVPAGEHGCGPVEHLVLSSFGRMGNVLATTGSQCLTPHILTSAPVVRPKPSVVGTTIRRERRPGSTAGTLRQARVRSSTGGRCRHDGRRLHPKAGQESVPQELFAPT